MADINVTSEQTRFRLDISNEIISRLVNSPMNLFGFGEARRGDNNMKYTWGEQTRSELFGVLNANYTPADPTLTVVDSSVFAINDQVHLKDHKDVNFQDLIFEITAIPNGTTITVTLVNGADTLATTVLNSQISIMRGFGDNAVAGTGTYEEAGDAFSYLQLFQEDFELGQKLIDRTAADGTYGINNLIAENTKQKIEDMAWRIWKQILYGVGRAETTAKPAMTKSLSETINQTSNLNRVDCLVGTLTETLLNDMVQQVLENGGREGPKMLLSNLTNVRTLSQLRHDKVNYVQEAPVNAFGGRVQVFNTEFANIGQITLVGDANFDKNTAMLIDLNSAEITPARGLVGNAGLTGSLTETTVPGTFGKRFTLRTELGFKVGQALRDHGVFYNLAG